MSLVTRAVAGWSGRSRCRCCTFPGPSNPFAGKPGQAQATVQVASATQVGIDPIPGVDSSDCLPDGVRHGVRALQWKGRRRRSRRPSSPGRRPPPTGVAGPIAQSGVHQFAAPALGGRLGTMEPDGGANPGLRAPRVSHVGSPGGVDGEQHSPWMRQTGSHRTQPTVGRTRAVFPPRLPPQHRCLSPLPAACIEETAAIWRPPLAPRWDSREARSAQRVPTEAPTAPSPRPGACASLPRRLVSSSARAKVSCWGMGQGRRMAESLSSSLPLPPLSFSVGPMRERNGVLPRGAEIAARLRGCAGLSGSIGHGLCRVLSLSQLL